MAAVNAMKHKVTSTTLNDGSMLLESGWPLGPVADNTSEWLHHWAEKTPQQVFLIERSGAGWREITYAETLQQVRALAAGLLDRGLGADTPVVVLSGPGIDHGLLMLAAHYIGVPIAPLAEQYSLIPEACERLDYCVRTIKPAMVYAGDGDKFGAALGRESLATVTKLVSVNVPSGAMSFDSLLKAPVDASVDAASDLVTPDTLAKILFTSGSTGNPKGVPQTQRMITVNQAQYSSVMPMLSARAPKVVDWLPWNHVFAGNSNFYMMLSNGGTLVLDDGKPVKGLFDRTLENLSMHTGTLSFNVPIAYSLLVEAFRQDKSLKQRFFGDLDLIFYAGATLPSDVWDALKAMSVEVTGTLPMMTSSWGLTETAPACLLHYQGGAESGMIGVPLPQLSARLIPYQGNRFEIRVKGPNVISAYFEAPEKNAESFDDEGYFITNDAVVFVDADDLSAGVRFDGRISEDFKLLSGTRVQAATLRLQVLKSLEGLVQDVVVTGADRKDVGLLIFPSPAIGPASEGDVVTDAQYLADVSNRLRMLSKTATGTSTQVVRALIMANPPSIKDAEITAKGSLNINAILSCRQALLERLYDDEDDACLLLE